MTWYSETKIERIKEKQKRQEEIIKQYRCMWTETNEVGIEEQCTNLTTNKPNPKNNNRVYDDEHQKQADKINAEKFKGYVKISALIRYIDYHCLVTHETGVKYKSLTKDKIHKLIYKLRNGELK